MYNNNSTFYVTDPEGENRQQHGPFNQVTGYPIARNSIIWHNDAHEGNILSGSIDGTASANSIVRGHPGGGTAIRNIDPFLKEDENYKLLPNSPARDEGDNAFIQAVGITLDIAGQPRIFDDGNEATPDNVDIGAHEYQGVRKPRITVSYPGEKGYHEFNPSEVVYGQHLLFKVMSYDYDHKFEIKHLIVDKGTPDEDFWLGSELEPWTDIQPFWGKTFLLLNVVRDHTIEVLIARKSLPFKVTIAAGLGMVRNELDGILVSLGVADGGPVFHEYTVPWGENTALFFQPAPGWRTKQVSVIEDMKEPVTETENLWSKKIMDVRVPHQIVVEFELCDDLEPLEPSFVKTISHPSDGLELVSYTVPDGFGRTVQTHSSLNDGQGRTMVSGGYFDPAGRPTHTVMPFVHDGPVQDFEFLPMGCRDLIRRANSYFDGENDENGVPLPNAEGFAYSETRYSKAPGAAVDKTGSPGKLRSADGHTAKSWAFGVETPESFLSVGELIESDLETRFESQNVDSPDMPYILAVAKDIDDKYSQSISDKFGNTLNVWSNPDIGSDLAAITFQSEYDILGRNVATYYPRVSGQLPQQASTVYNMRGQSVSVDDPDRNMVEYRYNSLGQLRFTRSAIQRNAGSDPNIGYFTVTNYDDLGRVVSMGINSVSAAQFDTPDLATIRGDEKIKKYYDGITAAQIEDMGVDGAIALRIAGELRNLYGSLAGSVSYTDDGRAIGEVFSYYPNGQLEASYKIIPVIGKVQKFAYEYDAKGEVVARKYFNGFDATDWNEVSRKEFEKDNLGRVVSVKENGEVFVTYSHNRIGDMQLKKFYANGSATPLKEVVFTSDIDGLRTIAADASHPGFRQNILYRDPVAPATFGGQIHSNEYIYRMDATTVSTELNKFEYDDAHRLSKVQRWSEDDEVFFEYGAYFYDQMGRFVSKKDGAITLADYEYVDGKNRLSRITGDPARNNPNGNFVYDPNGNMALDRSKKMTVDYDWRGMAVRYRFYNQIPNEALTWGEVRDGALDQRSGIDQVSVVEMEYDGGGQRVLKTDAAATDKITAYIGGLAVFQGTGPGAMALSYVNLVTAGGVTGKKDIAMGAEYFYIKDNLGSTRLVVKSDGQTQEVNSFESYGELSGLVPPPQGEGNVKELFTGKELDIEGSNGGMRVYYFGARYFDPELGVWLTPDPAGEFFNPYGRSGDPINFVDPDGRCEIICISIIAGAVIGGYLGGSAANSTFNPVYWDYTDSDTYLGIGTGAIIGGLSGASFGAGMGITGALGTGTTWAGVGGMAGLGLESVNQVQSGNFSAWNLFGSSIAGAAAGFAGGYTGSHVYGKLGAETLFGKAAAGWLSGWWAWTAGASTWSAGYGTMVEGDHPVGALLTMPGDVISNALNYPITTASLLTQPHRTRVGISGSSVIYSNYITDAYFDWRGAWGQNFGHNMTIHSQHRTKEVIRHEKRHVQQWTRFGLRNRLTGTKMSTGWGIFMLFNQDQTAEDDAHAFDNSDELYVNDPIWFSPW